MLCLAFSQTPPTKRYTKVQVTIFVDILLYLDQYVVPKAFAYHISPFYSTFNTKNRENIVHYRNTLF